MSSTSHLRIDCSATLHRGSTDDDYSQLFLTVWRRFGVTCYELPVMIPAIRSHSKYAYIIVQNQQAGLAFTVKTPSNMITHSARRRYSTVHEYLWRMKTKNEIDAEEGIDW